MRTELNLRRCRRLIDGAIRTFDLDLSGLTVLTEAATSCYGLTASLAALAGADSVVALTRDSRFGSADEAAKQTLSIAAALGVADRIKVTRDRDDAAIADADIVTNLGFVRPLDRSLLSRLKPTAVVSLMFETWEFRREDLDLAACRELGIAVLGTDESVPALRTMDYLAPVAMRLLFDCDIEVQGSNLIILGAGPFADALERGLSGIAGSVRRYDVALPRPRDGMRAVLANADAIIVAEHVRRDRLIGAGGFLSVAEIAQANPGLALVHIAGSVDRAEIAAAGLACAPDYFAPAGFMSVTTAHVGPRPLIELHAGGLKVGELLARARRAGASREDAERTALAASPICQAFDDPALAARA